MRNGILHLADLHVGAAVEPGLDDDLRSRLSQARENLLMSLARWICADENPVGLVLVAGDLFDRHDPPQVSKSNVRTGLATIARSVPVITLPGNHDEYSYAQCVFRQGDWPGILVTTPEPQLVWRGEVGGKTCAVVSAAYQAGKSSPGQKLQLPSRKEVLGKDGPDGVLIGLFHGTLAEHVPETALEAERCFWLSHKEAADRGYDYLALGHFHSRGEWRMGSCLAHYPGPPLGARISDPGSGYFSLVRVDRSSLKVEAVDATSILGFRWEICEIEVHPEESPQEIAQKLIARCGQLGGESNVVTIAVAKLRGSTTHSELAQQVQGILLEQDCRCVVVVEDVERVIPANVEELASEESLVGHFVRQWKAWREQADWSDKDASAVLYEGLLALGWRDVGSGGGQ
ncbi:MAG: metallophosphoesterase family protein [Thermogutta sp.]